MGELNKREKWNRYMRTYRAKHPERVRKSRRRQYLKRKIKAIKMVADPICNRCGCDELDFLEYNHIDGGGCKERRKDNINMTDRLLAGKRSSEGLEILCRVCNSHEFLERKNKKSAKGYKITYENYKTK